MRMHYACIPRCFHIVNGHALLQARQVRNRQHLWVQVTLHGFPSVRRKGRSRASHSVDLVIAALDERRNVAA